MPVVTRSKAYAATAARKKELESKRPSPAAFKIDFSSMKPRPVSDSFVFPKSTEQKLQEALNEIAILKKTKASIEKEFIEYMNERTKIIADLLGKTFEANDKVIALEEELAKLKN